MFLFFSVDLLIFFAKGRFLDGFTIELSSQIARSLTLDSGMANSKEYDEKATRTYNEIIQPKNQGNLRVPPGNASRK